MGTVRRTCIGPLSCVLCREVVLYVRLLIAEVLPSEAVVLYVRMHFFLIV